MNDSYQLEKLTWTDADFDIMNFHDTYIHAFAYDPVTEDLYLDIDYIFEWVHPPAGEVNFKFWAAPATLFFAHAQYLDILAERFAPGLQMQEITRTTAEPTEAIPNPICNWIVELENGALDFYTDGFTLYVRSAPQLCEEQYLTLEQRGGHSFARKSMESPS
jgi:hypothetical protein